MDIKKKKLGFRLLLFSTLFIPGLFVLFIIGCNCNYLIRFPFFIIIGLLILILIGLSIYGFIIFKKNREANKIRLKKWIKVVLSILVTFYILGCVGFITILYGPYDKFRTWLITTAMATMDHQYLCKWFYNDSQIQRVLSSNYIKESGESTDKTLVSHEKSKEYIDEYDKEILDVEEGTKYKIIRFEVDGEDAYLAAIYDPSMIKLQVTKELGRRGQYVTEMAKDTNAILAVNGGGFLDPNGSSLGGTPNGITIVDGEVITNGEYGSVGGLIGFTEDNTLVLLKNPTVEEAKKLGVRDAVTWGPFLIVNGKSSEIGGNGGMGFGARTAIGQRADGIVLFLVVDSNEYRTRGADMADLTEIMKRYHAVNAANLDGGTSSVIALPKSLAKSEFKATCHDYFTSYACAINDPIDSTMVHQTRYIADAWVVLDETGSINKISVDKKNEDSRPIINNNTNNVVDDNSNINNNESEITPSEPEIPSTPSDDNNVKEEETEGNNNGY